MNIIVIGRSIPEQKTRMIGLFEYTQAKALSKKENVSYFLLDARSILSNHLYKKREYKEYNLYVSGINFAFKGLPSFLYDKLYSNIFIKELKKLIEKQGKVDVIHIHFPLLTLNKEIWEYLSSLDSKIVVTEHWTAVLKNALTKKQLELARLVYTNADKVLAVSNPLAKSIGNIIENKRDIIECPNMVSDKISSSNIATGSNTDNFIYTFIGRIAPVKRVDILIEAFDKLLKRNENALLYIVGDGEKLNEMKTLASDLKIEKNIKFFGYQNYETIDKILNETNVFVTASELETFGVPIIEAWMKGLPAIAADNIPIKNYINEDNGLIFKKNDVDSLCDKMEEALLNYNVYDKNEIKKFAIDNFSEESVSKALLRIYNE